jgi:hypothetical protein
MAWREITVGETRWNVSPVAEKTQRTNAWRLVLAFRPSPPQRRSVWAPTELHSSSRTDLFAQADRLTIAKIVAALAERLR